MNLDPGFFLHLVYLSYHIPTFIKVWVWENHCNTLKYSYHWILWPLNSCNMANRVNYKYLLLANLYDTWKRARLKQTCCAQICTFLRTKSSFVCYKCCFATIYFSRYVHFKLGFQRFANNFRWELHALFFSWVNELWLMLRVYFAILTMILWMLCWINAASSAIMKI